jgi:hypothetical protein
MSMTLEQYRELITIERCPCWCQRKLARELSHYDHDGGWPAVGFEKPQWLYLTCNRGHEWAFWKLENASIADQLRRLERDIEEEEVQP